MLMINQYGPNKLMRHSLIVLVVVFISVCAEHVVFFDVAIERQLVGFFYVLTQKVFITQLFVAYVAVDSHRAHAVKQAGVDREIVAVEQVEGFFLY